MNSTMTHSQRPMTMMDDKQQQEAHRLDSSMEKKKSNKAEHQKEVASLVSSLADKKRQDLDLVRQYLAEPQKQQQAQGTNKWSLFSFSKASPPPPPSSKPFFLQPPALVISQDDHDDEIIHPTKKKKKKQKKSKPHSSVSTSWKLARCLAVDLPLMLLFVSLAMIYSMRHAWTHYYIPIMERAKRTDTDLLDEYTYYERTCSAEDVTQGFTINSMNTTTSDALDTLLQHGATTIPKLLRPQTIARLRKYLRHRNKVVTDEEAFPMSQPHQRVSYGIEATEDTAVSDALGEITSHALLPDLLEQILGVPDPALTEITAITSYYGAEDQVIHSDTKSDGYAAQFARTYAHTYSLFIPVQPITQRMGVTQLCPGTHYCTNSMEEVCRRSMFGVNQAFQDKIWKAGDGMLLNQQVWHGGSKHTDPRNNERIMFIVSFTARPQLGKDHRQLARGTYFHMKWLMWGHVWSDIATDDAISMSWPFNILRSLALWKPSNKKWGYDLLLSAALRAANQQLGMEAEELHTFIELKMDGLFHVPKWLQGPFSTEPDAWRTYIQVTLDNMFVFLQAINAVVLVVYVMVACTVSLFASRSQSATTRLRRVGSILFRLAATHGLVALLTWYILASAARSPWGSNIQKGLTYRRPFPTDNEFTSHRFEADPTVGEGLTTLPDRMDVLFGTRYDAPYLGSYNRWLDYHPGNQVFQAAVASRAHAYDTLYNYNPNDNLYHQPVLLQNLLIDDILTEVNKKTSGGRLLQQDHLSGDWVVLGKDDAKEMVRTVLATESNAMRKALHRQLNYLVADYRFGTHRGKALAMESVLYLNQFRKSLLGTTQPLTPTVASSRTDTRTPVARTTLASRMYLPVEPMKATVADMAPSPSMLPSFSNRRIKPSEEKPRVGSKVMVFHSVSSSWFKATIQEVVRENSRFDILYEDGEYEEDVSIRRLRRWIPLTEGIRVSAVMEDDQSYFGSVTLVYPSGNVDLLFDDGDILQDVQPEDIDIQYPQF